MKKLYLIDGMSVVFRAYHAMSRSGLQSPSGEPTFAVFAFANILTTLLEKENPEHLAVVFDTREPTFRHEKYPEYKANRDEFPEDLEPQLERIKELIDYLKIPRIEKPGFEADDIIGTLADRASKQGIEVACLTNDKDYYQLINDNISIYKPGKNAGEFDIISYEGVEEKFGVRPEQVIDVMALTGDSSDNIPGVKGIGPKTAGPLVKQFGSLENLYEHLEEIQKPAVKNKLEANKENAFLSKYLVTIIRNVKTELQLNDITKNTPDFEKLIALFKQLGFNTLTQKWFEKSLKEVSSSEARKIEEIKEQNSGKKFDTKKVKYRLIDDGTLFNKILKEIRNAKLLSVDLETSSLNRTSCEIAGIALSIAENTGYYIPVYGFPFGEKPAEKKQSEGLFADEKDTEKIKKENKYKALETGFVLGKLKEILESGSIGKCGQNLKFDAYILKRYGINLRPVVFDSMIASYVLNSDEQHNLTALSQKWLDYTPIPISTLIGEKKASQKSMKDIDPALIADYACEDADLALKLRNKMHPELVKHDLVKLAEEIEFPLIETLTDMEYNGAAIDKDALEEFSHEIKRETARLTEEIHKEAGTEFNIDSTKQLAHVLFEKLMIPPLRKTKTGYSTDAAVLTELAKLYPIANMIIDYRQLMKLKSTYVDALPKLINPNTGRLHTTYNQTVASTGRLSSTDPNLQNIPIRTEMGRKIRKAFVPQFPDRTILSADYSQVELRIMAYYSGDKHLKEAFIEGLDIHSATAAVLFDTDLEKVDQNMRRTAKTVNFGIMYGLGPFGLSQRLDIERSEAQNIIDNYFDKYPGIKKYIDETIESTKKKGYAETMKGRRRYFPDITSRNRNKRTAAERAAINMPIQGTASDMMKIAMLCVDARMKREKMKSLMMLQVHDELVFEAFNDELDELTELVKYEMERALPLGEIPVVVDTGAGENWYKAH